MDFRDMQEQGTFHAGREYERKILTKRIEELERVQAGVRVSLIAMRTAVEKGGSVSEAQLKDLIDELEAK